MILPPARMTPAQIESYADWLEKLVAGTRGRLADFYRNAAAELRQAANPWGILP